MTLRPQPLLTLSVAITSLLAVSVACSSDEADSNDTGTQAGTGTPTSTTASTTGASTTTGTTGTTGTTVATTASGTTASTSGVSTTASSSTDSSTTGSSTTGSSTSGSSTTGSFTTGTGGATSSNSSSSGGGAGGMGTTGGSTEFTLTSPAFADDGMCSWEMPDTCEYFPTENSSFHDNESPELNWTPGPQGTLSYVVVMHDLRNGFAHWALWNLSAETLSLPAALPGDAMLTTPVVGQQVNASFAAGDGYFGPGSCMNVYEFKLYALSVGSFTPANAMSPDAIQDELEESDIVLGTATLRAQANPDDLPDGMPCN